MYNSGKNVWANELRERRADVPMETVEKYLQQRLPPAARLRVQRVARFCAHVPDADACPGG